MNTVQQHPLSFGRVILEGIKLWAKTISSWFIFASMGVIASLAFFKINSTISYAILKDIIIFIIAFLIYFVLASIAYLGTMLVMYARTQNQVLDFKQVLEIVANRVMPVL